MEKEDIQKQQLQDYINYLIGKGYSKKQIREYLIEKGFDKFLVREVIYPNLKLFVSAGIIYILMILVIGGFLAYTLLNSKHGGGILVAKEKTEETLLIAPLPENREYTLGEIMGKGATEGLDFCNTLEKKDIKKTCIESYIFNRAKQELNASICKESKDSVFVRDCQYRAIVPAVAKKYCEESKAQNNTNIAPSNINLCKQIDNEQDREKCYNPKQVVDESDVGGIYFNRKCEGYINLY